VPIISPIISVLGHVIRQSERDYLFLVNIAEGQALIFVRILIYFLLENPGMIVAGSVYNRFHVG